MKKIRSHAHRETTGNQFIPAFELWSRGSDGRHDEEASALFGQREENVCSLTGANERIRVSTASLTTRKYSSTVVVSLKK